jgi:hypothetical protein
MNEGLVFFLGGSNLGFFRYVCFSAGRGGAVWVGFAHP